jgi:hypothetical protein
MNKYYKYLISLVLNAQVLYFTTNMELLDNPSKLQKMKGFPNVRYSFL